MSTWNWLQAVSHNDFYWVCEKKGMLYYHKVWTWENRNLEPLKTAMWNLRVKVTKQKAESYWKLVSECGHIWIRPKSWTPLWQGALNSLFFLLHWVFPLITESVLSDSSQLQSKCCSGGESIWPRTFARPEQSRKRSYLQVVMSKPRWKRCVRKSQVKRKDQVQRLFPNRVTKC